MFGSHPSLYIVRHCHSFTSLAYCSILIWHYCWLQYKARSCSYIFVLLNELCQLKCSFVWSSIILHFSKKEYFLFLSENLPHVWCLLSTSTFLSRIEVFLFIIFYIPGIHKDVKKTVCM
jgi:hypothetical protein